MSENTVDDEQPQRDRTWDGINLQSQPAVDEKSDALVEPAKKTFLDNAGAEKSEVAAAKREFMYISIGEITMISLAIGLSIYAWPYLPDDMQMWILFFVFGAWYVGHYHVGPFLFAIFGKKPKS